MITDLFEAKIAHREPGRPARPGGSAGLAAGAAVAPARPAVAPARPAVAPAGAAVAPARPAVAPARPAVAPAGPAGTTAGPASTAARLGGSAAAQAGAAAARATFPDWRFSPNIGGRPEVYELENRAVDGAGHVLAAMRGLAPWQDRTLIDLGCGTGYWLARYAGQAREIIGIEPDPVLRAAATTRARGLPATTVRAGSAERLPLASCSADVVHARFAYFLSPGGAAGLAEVLRVLRPGGSLVVVDNDHRWGDFAGLLAAGSANAPQRTAATIDTWWRERGAARTEVHSELRFASRADLAAVLEIELPAAVASSWLARNPAATGLTYGYVLFAVTRPASGWLRGSQPRPGLRSKGAGHGPG